MPYPKRLLGVMPTLLVILLLSNGAGCQSQPRKLESSFLQGKPYEELRESGVSALETKRVYRSGIDPASSAEEFQRHLDSLTTTETFWGPPTSKLTFFPNGKIDYSYPSDRMLYDVKYHYDTNGWLSERLYFGTESKSYYSREFFTYNTDTTRCVAEKYKMRNKETPYYDPHVHVDDSDSLFLIEQYERAHLENHVTYLRTENGYREIEISYDDGGDRIWQKSSLERYDESDLEYRYRYVQAGSFISVVRRNEQGDIIEQLDYQLRNRQQFDTTFNFEKDNMRDLDFSDETIFALNPSYSFTAEYSYDQNGNLTQMIYKYPHDPERPDYTERYQYFYTEGGDWDGKIVFNNQGKSIRAIFVRRMSYFSQKE